MQRAAKQNHSLDYARPATNKQANVWLQLDGTTSRGDRGRGAGGAVFPFFERLQHGREICIAADEDSCPGRHRLHEIAGSMATGRLPRASTM